jgi:hypothetical protein
MSPVPEQIPRRISFARVLCSPPSLLLGFVVLLIVTCPGARGEGVVTLIPDGLATFVSGANTLEDLDVSASAVAATTPARLPVRPMIRESSRLDRLKPKAARSAAPRERSEAATDSFTHSRAALPLLVDPLLAEGKPAQASGLRPMTGPPVGIRPKLPTPKLPAPRM